jgi:hypothetical protein
VNHSGRHRVRARLSYHGAFGLFLERSRGETRAAIPFGPGITTLDASIVRNFPIRSHSLQFRFEAFNALNQPVWGDPNTTLSNPLYGSITTTRKPMRELQVGLYVF